MSDVKSFEAELATPSEQYVLRLYVLGATRASQRAISSLTEILEDRLPGRYTLEVIDVFQRPALAVGEQIIATPTLLRLLPEPVARLVGDMSNRDKVLLGLDLRIADDHASGGRRQALE